MKNNLIHKIFGLKIPMSRSELDKSLELVEELGFDLESRLLSSSFDAEAREGFRIARLSTADMSKLDKNINEMIGSSSSNSFQTWFMFAWFILFITILITPLTFYITTTVKTNQTPLHSNHNLESHNTNEEHSQYLNTAAIDYENTIDERFTISTDKQHITPRSKNNQSKSTSDTPIIHGVDETPRPMEIKIAEILNMRAQDLGIKKTKTKEIALSNFIFIDFRGIRAEQTITTETTLSGTGAHLSHRETKNNDVETLLDKSEVAYHDYLTKTARILQLNDYNTALHRFKTILKHYPKDENALFYAAYCLFHLGQHQESLSYLEQLAKSIYANFDEECDWYIFKCYIKLNRTSDARRVAEKIAEQGGFYSEQARDFLKKR